MKNGVMVKHWGTVSGDYKMEHEDVNTLYYGRVLMLPEAIYDQLNKKSDMLKEWIEDNISLEDLIKECEQQCEDGHFPDYGIIELYITHDVDNAKQLIMLIRIPLTKRVDSEKVKQ